MSRTRFGEQLGRFIAASTPGSRLKKRKTRVARCPMVESLENRSLLANAGVDVITGAFAPNPVTIHLGDTVEWVWDMNDLSTTSVKGSVEQWDSGVLNAGATFEHTFTHVGSFVYYSTVGGTDTGNGTASGMVGMVTVLPSSPITMLMLMPANYSIPAGTTQQFMAMSMYADNSTTDEDASAEATWTSSDPAVATVSNAPGSQGLVTGVAAGTTTISASFDGISGSTPFTVTTASSAPPFMPTSMPMPMPTPSSTSPPLVWVTSVQVVRNKKHMVTEVTVDFSGALNAAEADHVGTYRLATPGKKESFAAKNASVITLKSAAYNPALNEVTLTPKKPFALTKPVQVQVNGLPPSGLQDSEGRLIDGGHDNVAGGNAEILLSFKGGTLSAVVANGSGTAPTSQGMAALQPGSDDMSDMSMTANAAHLKNKKNMH